MGQLAELLVLGIRVVAAAAFLLSIAVLWWAVRRPRKRRAVADWRCTRCCRLKGDIWVNGCTRMVRGAMPGEMELCNAAPLVPIDAEGKEIPFEELGL